MNNGMAITNDDCSKCAKSYKKENTGDYKEEYFMCITYGYIEGISIDKKPCKLKEGKYYVGLGYKLI